MLSYLKQSTASQIRAVGPFVDDTDFKTAETGLTIANTDVKLMKNGGTSANKNSGGGTHLVNGVYSLTFDATDTATVGELTGSIVVAGAAPVIFKFYVLEEAIFDALFGASAAGFNASGLVTLAAVTHTGAVIPTVSTLTNAPSDSSGTTTLLSRLSSARAGYLDNLSAGAVALASSLTSLAGKFTGITLLSEWLGLIAGKQTGNSTARTELRASGAGSGTYDETTDSLEAQKDGGATLSDLGILNSTTIATLASQTSFTLTAGSADNDAYNGCQVIVTDSSTAVQKAVGVVSDYTGSTKTITLTGDPGVFTMAIGDSIVILPPAAAGGSGLDAAATRAALGMSSANLDTQLSGLQSDTNDIQTRLPAALVSGRIDASAGAIASGVITATSIASDAITAAKIATDAITAGKIATDAFTAAKFAADVTTEFQTGLATAASIAALNNISTAQVLTQVNAALDTAIAELAADPTATPTTRTALMLLYMSLRNASTTTASAQTIKNSAGTTILTKALSDDATTFTAAKVT